MPAAVWYVDNPNLIVKTFDVNVSPYVSIFVWDGNYVKDMESMGFEEVVYLPLATDEEVFRPMDLSRSELKKRGTDVGFVGNSMVEPVRSWLERVPRGFHPLIEELAQVLSRTRQTVAQGLEISGNEAKLDSLTEAEKLDFEGAVLWRATLLYRRSCVRKLAGFRHRIHGDEGWTQLLGNGYQVHPKLGYYSEVPRFYNACRINLNATNLQMGSAVNQRVFDVPACGAFILTDYQDSLTGLFEPEQECVFYREPEEIPDLIRFYLKNPSAARAVTLKARHRVLKEHTYAHRLGRIIDHMQHRYGRVHG
jgi:spore maturation protein CgeB